MFEIFFKINETLQEIRDLMVKMEKHLSDLTDPPDLNEWADYKTKYKKEEEE